MRKTIINKGIAILTSLALLIPAVNNLAGTAEIVKAADYGISNPRIAADGTVTWDKIQFGSYKQSVEFEKQPIKWRILSVNEDGTDAFVMADRALDCKTYNETYESVTWETCTLRSWLNNEFYNEAFSSGEQTAIKEVTVTNEDNPFYNTEGGNSTTDKVYLLSIDEASNEDYGFDSSWGSLSRTRYVRATDYARMNGAYRSNSSGYAGNCYWWLRSPGDTSDCAADVSYDGAGNDYGRSVYYDGYAVCPALHINLSSMYVEDAGEVDSDGKVTTSDNGYNNPRTTAGVTTWDCVYFGNYKQDVVTVNEEPIEWKVLSVNGDDAFIMADRALDCKPYYETYESVTWETCTLRNWLNNEFYNEAFSIGEQMAIKEVTVTNDDNQSYNTEGGNSTTDKVYLLSIDEASKKEYGFDSELGNESMTRYVKATDYARMNGAYRSDSSGYAGNCYWWLRSPGRHSYYAAYVRYDGAGEDYGHGVIHDDDAVCPALHINLSSDTWKSAGTASAKLSNYDPTTTPTDKPENTPNATPTAKPTESPTSEPVGEPTASPTGTPVPDATAEPTVTSTPTPINEPTVTPTAMPTAKPTESTTSEPVGEPTASPTGTPVPDATAEPTVTSTPTPINEPTVTPTAVPTNKPESTSSAVPTNVPIVTATSTTAPVATQSGSVTQSSTPSSFSSATPQPEKTTAKKQIKLTSVKTKAKSKKITGKVSIKGVTIKIKIGKKSYKKVIKGNKFTVNLSKKLKSKDKVVIVASKKNYTSFKKTYTVK